MYAHYLQNSLMDQIEIWRMDVTGRECMHYSGPIFTLSLPFMNIILSNVHQIHLHLNTLYLLLHCITPFFAAYLQEQYFKYIFN